MPFRCRLYCAILLCLLALFPTATAPAVWAQSPEPEPQPGELLRIDFTTRAELQRIAGQLDVWEVHLDEGYLLAYVLPGEREWLESLGLQLEHRAVLQPQTIPDYACYHLISEQYATLAGWAAAYPKIARLITIGYSYEGRPLQMLHIGNRSIPGPRPPLVVIANTHGRELITNEVALAFAGSLLTTYGTDADTTWMVDYHDIYVMPSLNPDGHVRNEKGTPWAQWRKNTHLYPGQSIASCPPGVDLNRNSTVDWNWDNLGSSGSLCSFNYRGPSVRSEPETKAIETFMAGVFADQKAPGRTIAAPETATGVFITLHSYGNLLMWPWGAVSTASGNEAQYGYLGRKLASFNGYQAARSYAIMGYATNGTTDDTAYGIYGVASFTYEIGSGTDGFYPACSRAPALINPNVASLRFAAACRAHALHHAVWARPEQPRQCRRACSAASH